MFITAQSKPAPTRTPSIHWMLTIVGVSPEQGFQLGLWTKPRMGILNDKQPFLLGSIISNN
jgi:hypothetical protein